MKPNLALSLSSEGIRLLHRAAGGWRVVGDVPLDSDDLGGALADLRRSIAPFEKGSRFCKLLLPEAQVKYMTIDTPDMSDDTRRAAARRALDGATPYAVSDLVFDISPDGDRTHIAAVARETLVEAETFATEHNFKPVSFATVPGDQPYLGEPFFGQTEAARRLLRDGQQVEPDGIAVVEIGKTATPIDRQASADPVETPAEAPQDGASDDASVKTPEPQKQTPTPVVAPAPEPPTKTKADPDPLAPSPGADAATRPADAPKDKVEDKVEDTARETPAPGVPVSSSTATTSALTPENTAAEPTGTAAKSGAPDAKPASPPAPDEPVLQTGPDAGEPSEGATPEPAVPVEKTPKVAPEPSDTPAPGVPEAPEDGGKTPEPAPEPAVPVEKSAPPVNAPPVKQGPAAPPVAPRPAPAPKPPVAAKPAAPAKPAARSAPPAAPRDGSHATPTATTTEPELAPTPDAAPPLDPPRKPKVAPLPPLRADRTPTPSDPPKIAAPATALASHRSDSGVPSLGGERRAPTPGQQPGNVPKPDSSSLDAPRAAPVAAAAAATTGFLSRRKTASTADVGTAPAPRATAPAGATTAAASSEAERMTVFGARRDSVGGKPRFLGLILTAALLLFLAAVAAWASVFLDDGLNLSRLFGTRSTPQIAAAPVPAAPETAAMPGADTEGQVDEATQNAALDPGLTEEDGAVLDALRDPEPPQIEGPSPENLSEAELDAKYAATGIWTRAPQVPSAPEGQTEAADIYLASIDPISTAADAIALPALDSLMTDAAPEEIASPAAAGTRFAFNAQGLVIPTSAGTVNPEGVTVYLGQPDKLPPQAFLARYAAPQEAEETPVLTARADTRPRTRPGDLVETAERAQFDGLTRDELADKRPTLRPENLAARATPEVEAPTISPEDTADAIAEAMEAPLAAALPDAFESPTKFATTASRRPDTRPNDFNRIVRRAEPTAPAPETRVASAAAVAPAPRVVAPSIPSTASVAKQATVRNAINMRRISLIGVYGKPSNRRALVRLGNGRYEKVVVGDRIDGGRVAAIGDNALRYTKGSRNYVLEMPN